ncbi:MAG TPA: hypothetical protein VMD59_22720 [Acidimicrobiales bacterium]|nr:hypothetical protein [Acidimicrobiales bacterium]
MIVVGYRRRRQRFGTLMWNCQRCKGATPHALVGGRTYVTLFFVPVVPIPMRKALLCTQCGLRTSAPKDQLPAIMQAASVGAARAAAIQAAAAQSVGGPMAPPFPAVTASAFPAYPAPAGGMQSLGGGQGAGPGPGGTPPAAGQWSSGPAPGQWSSGPAPGQWSPGADAGQWSPGAAGTESPVGAGPGGFPSLPGAQPWLPQGWADGGDSEGSGAS